MFNLIRVYIQKNERGCRGNSVALRLCPIFHDDQKVTPHWLKVETMSTI